MAMANMNMFMMLILLLDQMKSPQAQTWYGAVLGTLIASLLSTWHCLMFLLCLSKRFRGWRKNVEDWLDGHDEWAKDRAIDKSNAEEPAKAENKKQLGKMIKEAVLLGVKAGLEEERKRIRLEMQEEIEKSKREWVERGRMEERKKQAERAKKMGVLIKELGENLDQLKKRLE
jgi:hypothetical protein